MIDLDDIPQLPRAHYEVSVAWSYLEEQLARWGETWEDKGVVCGGIDMNPDYQREHVWTPQQQIAYVEYVLRGGEVGRNIVWNNPTWGNSFKGKTELIDGKQRLEAVRSFLRGDITAFGFTVDQFAKRVIGPTSPDFRFQVCMVKTREEILQLYLNINAGGTPHTPKELARVRKLLEKERKKPTKRTKKTA